MDIQSIRKIIFPAINNAIKEMEENNLECNVTLLKRIVNEAVDGSLNRNHSSLSNIIGDFSGRGRAWAKTDVCNENPVWHAIKDCLELEISSAQNNSDVFKKCANMIDLFESSGFAWMRFAGVNNKTGIIRFQIRVWGSKLEDHIKLYVNKDVYNHIKNLEGVPHNLGLESGNFSQDTATKEKIEIDVSREDLTNLGIQTLEDLIGEN